MTNKFTVAHIRAMSLQELAYYVCELASMHIDSIEGLKIDDIKDILSKNIESYSQELRQAEVNYHNVEGERVKLEHQLEEKTTELAEVEELLRRYRQRRTREREPMKNVMIDLETVSLRPTAAIISIGAVVFDVEEERLGPEFYSTIDLNSSLLLGLSREQGALDWWAKEENREARDKLTIDAKPLPDVLSSFNKWLGNDTTQIVPWSNGATFDIVILKNALETCGLSVPWKYFNESCYRTLKRLYPQVLMPRQTLKHHALEDAKYQAKHCMRILNSLRLAEEVTTR
jgi:DNA polymerase III epsilon subunit-like protein